MEKTNDALTDYATELADLALKIMGGFHNFNRGGGHPQTLTMRQYQAMILLSVHKNLTISDMCEKLTLAPSTGTELINRLLQLDYIEKQTASEDRRIHGLSISILGKKVLKERQQQIVNMLSSFLESFNENEVEELIHSFRSIYILMQAHAPHPNPPK